MKLLIRTLVSIVSFCSASLSVAQSDFEKDLSALYGDEDFVSIATGRRQLISEAPSVASVITAQDIQQTGARTLDQALEMIPGLHVSVKAGGYNSIYSIRGIHSEFNPQVLVLVNGFPITNLNTGNRGEVWAQMPVSNISRIEVIRGPGSAIYGADAFAGTINIITKSSADIEVFEVGGAFGSFDTTEVWALYGGQFNDWDVAFSLDVYETDGHDERITWDNQTTLDLLLGTNASYAPGAVAVDKESVDVRGDLAKDNWRFRVGYQYVEGGVGAGAAGALDPAGEGSGDRLNFDITYDNKELAENWELTGSLSYYDISNEIDLVLLPPGVDFSALGGFSFPEGIISNPNVFERHTRFDVSGFYTGFDNHDIRVGAGYQHQDQYKIEETKNYQIVVTPFGPAYVPLGGVVDVSETLPFNQEKIREVFYAFIQDEWRLAQDWSLTAGLRFDDYSDFGSTVNPRLALVWQTNLNLTSKLLYGRAFRAPSFTEQFNINNPIAVGNDNLDPETIDTYELVFDYLPSPEFRTGINIFYYKMEDIIRFAPVALNTGNQKGHGLELEFEWSISDSITFSGNYALQSSEDVDFDSDAPYAPEQQVFIRVDYELNNTWSANTLVNHLHGRRRQAMDTRSGIDNYTTADITLRGVDVVFDLDFTLTVKNLFDENVREPSFYREGGAFIPNDLPLSGRSVVAVISKRW